MKKKLNVYCKKYILVFFTILFLLHYTLNGNELTLKAVVTIISLISLIIYSHLIYYSYKKGNGVNLFLIFLFLSYFFYFGEHLLVAINYEGYISILTDKISISTIINTSFLIFYTFIILTFFFHYFQEKIVFRNILCQLKKDYVFDNESFKKTVYIMFFISVIPMLIQLSTSILENNSDGYANRVLNTVDRTIGIDISSIILLFSAFFIPSLIGMYILKKWKIAIPATIAYSILYLMTGSRLLIYCLVVLLIAIYSYLNPSKISKKNVVIIFITLLLLVTSLVIVSKNRANEKINHLSSKEILNLVISQSLSQTGTIFTSTAIVIEKTPSYENYVYGKTYLSGLLYILPNRITGDYPMKNGNVDDVFSPYLVSYGKIGSSFIAEAYYNFGYFSLAFMVVISFFWAILEFALKYAIKNSANIITLFSLYSYYYISITVRSESIQIFRYIIWYFIPFIILQYILFEIKRRKLNALMNGNKL